MAPPVVFVLLGLLSSAKSLPPPRTSFLLNSPYRPLAHFRSPDVHNTTTLLLSDGGSTLYVGARDAVLSLDVSQRDVIRMKRKVQWAPSENETSSCGSKGKNRQVDCPNFVSVLQPFNSTHLYACGSYAYGPRDAYIDAETFALEQHEGAKGRCPFSPFERSTAITVDGELFTASSTNFRGTEPQISRHFSKHGRPDVTQDSVSYLDEPAFVRSSFDAAESKVYFFFTETGKEFSYVDVPRVSRVAQVCKDDVGGQRTLQKKWTSFAKGLLLCGTSKQFRFNVLQDVFALEPQGHGNASETLFYGVFTSQWSSRPESAVCVFRLRDIRTLFAGSYKSLNMGSHQWTQHHHSYLGKCGLDSASDTELGEVKKIFLTSGSLKPPGDHPLVVSSDQRYTRVAAMTTPAADGKLYTVLFILTESGFLHKVVLLSGGARVIEEVQVSTQPQRVQSIVLSSSKGVVFVGTAEGVTAVPVARCSVYVSCSQCVLARDPLCGWSQAKGLCTSVSDSPEALVQDLEQVKVEEKCPRQTRRPTETEVGVTLNEAVRLECFKPSNLASLTWTSPQFNADRDKLFIQSPDNSLRFFATAATLGTYRCVAEEGGYSEVVASYVVRQRASPRSKTAHHVTHSLDEPLEDIETEEPTTDGPAASSERQPVTVGSGEKLVTVRKVYGPKTGFERARPSTEAPPHKELPGEAREEKSYLSALVVVSLLLLICVCVLVLGGFHMRWPDKLGLKGKPGLRPQDDGRGNGCMEKVPSLSSPEDAGPDVMVVEK